MTDHLPPRKSGPADSPAGAAAIPRQPLPLAAQRALAEAEARRVAARESEGRPPAKEIAGPEGPEPTRYGDWEKKGIASDF
ncbi:MAG: DUF1674 domain-containing protein [Rhizobiales bacterium]|nr:DUF1674 domain-containing protein [Hyphomicrobiales bacterium]